jgi:hypothetical protein
MANKPAVHTLGDVYLFIHQRAQFIRKQKAAGVSVSEAETPAAYSTPAQKQSATGSIHNGK